MTRSLHGNGALLDPARIRGHTLGASLEVPLSLLLSSLLACVTPDEEGGLRRAPEADDPPVVEWTPGTAADTGGSTGDRVASALCGGAQAGQAAWRDGGDSLALEWCVRVTPEVDPLADTGGADSGALEGPELPLSGAPPPPCSFSNLVGAVRIAGDPADPLLLYCDTDGDGGLRSVNVEADGSLQTWLLVPNACLADMSSGTLTVTDQGVEALYVDTTGAGVASDPVAASIALSGLGAPTGSIQPFDAGTVPAELDHVQTAAGERIVVLGREGDLWLVDRAGGAPVALGQGLRTAAAVAWGEGLLVAACTDQGALVAAAVSTSAPTWSPVTVDAAGCDLTSRPELATSADRALLASHNAEAGGRLRLLDPDLQVRAVEDLGLDATWPAVAWDAAGARFASIDATGQVATWDTALSPLGAWRHPMVAQHAGSIFGFRVAPGADAWAFAVLGLDSVPTSAGHLNTFYWVELSTAAAP